MAGPTVVILGAGVGGLVAARALRRRLGPSGRVVVVEQEETHVFAPSLLWLMVGQRQAPEISRPFARLARKGLEVVSGRAVAIDPQTRTLVLQDGTSVRGDYLLLSPGAAMVPEAIPGLSEAGHNFYTLDGAERLRQALATLRGGRVVVLVASLPYKCPAAPCEAAFLIDAFFRREGIRPALDLALYTPEPGPMPVAGPALSGAVVQMLQDRDIGYFPQHSVVAVDPQERSLRFSNGTVAPYDLLAYVPPHRPPALLQNSDLGGRNGWISVDPGTLQTSFPGVFGLGDATEILLPAGLPLPKAGVFAHEQAEVIARNIAREVRGQGKVASFDGRGSCFIELGEGRAGFARGSFYHEPRPQVKMYAPCWCWHWLKVIFEKLWLWESFGG